MGKVKGILLILAVGLVLVASPVFGEQSSNKREAYCSQISKMAKEIMEIRQMGYPMFKLMKKTASKLEKKMVIEAYEKIRWHTEEQKEKAVQKFSNEWYLGCIKAKQGGN